MLTENSQDDSSDPESTETILKVREKASDVKMYSQTIINNRLKELTSNRKKAYRMILTSQQLEGKQDLAKHLLDSLARTGESPGEHVLKDRLEFCHDPVALDASRL